jgi:hypothetical protein
MKTMLTIAALFVSTMSHAGTISITTFIQGEKKEIPVTISTNITIENGGYLSIPIPEEDASTPRLKKVIIQASTLKDWNVDTLNLIKDLKGFNHIVHCRLKETTMAEANQNSMVGGFLCHSAALEVR